MSLYEIIRDDNVLVFQEAMTRTQLETTFLSALRVENETHGYTVYRLDNDMNHIGRKKVYIPVKDDKEFAGTVHKLMQDIFSTFVDKIKASGLKSGFGVIDEDGNIHISADDTDIDIGENCDECEDYDACNLLVKKPKGK